jgi:hypothetical protein
MSITEALADLDPLGLVAALREVYTRLAEAPLWSLSEAQALDLVTELTAVGAQHTAARLTAVREVDSRGSALATGASSTTTWLKGTLLDRPGAAAKTVRLAKALAERYEATGAALAHGEISADHANVICTVLEDLPTTLPIDTRIEAEQFLLGQAAVLNPARLAQAGRYLRYVLDPDGEKELAALEARQSCGRELWLSPRDSGYWDLKGRLDPVAGAELWTLLDALSAPKPSGADGPDPRTAPQRRADALVSVIEHHLEHGPLPDQGGERPTLIITTTLEQLMGRPLAGAATLPDGSPLSAGAVRRMACDCKVIPMVMGGDSQPLDIGRASRSVPAHLRRAVYARDGNSCATPGCLNRPRQAHHITPWWQLGATEIDNLVSLCGHCHRWFHQGRERLITAVKGGKPVFHTGPLHTGPLHTGPAP